MKASFSTPLKWLIKGWRDETFHVTSFDLPILLHMQQVPLSNLWGFATALRSNPSHDAVRKFLHSCLQTIWNKMLSCFLSSAPTKRTTKKKPGRQRKKISDQDSYQLQRRLQPWSDSLNLTALIAACLYRSRFITSGDAATGKHFFIVLTDKGPFCRSNTLVKAIKYQRPVCKMPGSEESMMTPQKRRTEGKSSA